MEARFSLCVLVITLHWCNTAAAGGGRDAPGHALNIGESDLQTEKNDVYTHTPCSCQQIRNSHENLEQILDRKLQPLWRMMAELRDSQRDLVRSVGELAGSMLPGLAANVTGSINSNVDYTDNQTMTITEKINRSLDLLGNDVQNSTTRASAKLQNITNTAHDRTAEAADVIPLEQSTDITKQIDDKMISLNSTLKTTESDTKKVISDINLFISNIDHSNDTAEAAYGGPMSNVSIDIADDFKSVSYNEDIQKSLKEIKQKLLVLDNIPNLEQNVKKLKNLSEKIYRNTLKISQNVSESDFTLLCEEAAEEAAPAEEEAPAEDGRPGADRLDRWLAERTGCRYASVGYGEPVASSGSARGREWRAALRPVGAGGYFALELAWDDRVGLAYRVGIHDHTLMIDLALGAEVERRHTPGVVRPGRYTPVLVQLQAGCVTFSAACSASAAPVFRRCDPKFAEDRPAPAHLVLYSYSHSGAKFLLDCPAP